MKNNERKSILQKKWCAVFQQEILVLELLTIDRFTSCAIVFREITSLNLHNKRNKFKTHKEKRIILTTMKLGMMR